MTPSMENSNGKEKEMDTGNTQGLLEIVATMMVLGFFYHCSIGGLKQTSKNQLDIIRASTLIMNPISWGIQLPMNL